MINATPLKPTTAWLPVPEVGAFTELSSLASGPFLLTSVAAHGLLWMSGRSTVNQTERRRHVGWLWLRNSRYPHIRLWRSLCLLSMEAFWYTALEPCASSLPLPPSATVLDVCWDAGILHRRRYSALVTPSSGLPDPYTETFQMFSTWCLSTATAKSTARLTGTVCSQFPNTCLFCLHSVKHFG